MMIRDITSSLDDEPKESMEQTMSEWLQRRRGSSAYDTGGSITGNESSVTLPLSPGEWDTPLGLPLCVVCHGVRSFSYSPAFLNGYCEKGLMKCGNRQIKLTPSKWSTAGKKSSSISYYNSCEPY